LRYKSVRQRLDHPFFPVGGYVREHRRIYEEIHKCTLLPWGVVHHIDGDRGNNDPDNLVAMMKSHHDRVTQRQVWLGRKHSEETKRMMSIMRKGKPSNRKGATQSLESRMKMSLAHKGKKLSKEHKRKIGESCRLKCTGNTWKGKRLSEEHRANIRNGVKNSWKWRSHKRNVTND
jgi:HNH endonuclease/NUMOD3 motif